MRRIKRWTTMAATGAWLALPAAAWAGEASKGKASYVLSYAVVLMFVGLGMLGVCLVTRRQDRARPEQYGD